MSKFRGVVVISERGFIYRDMTNWLKVKRCKCGASNNTEVVTRCLACHRPTTLLNRLRPAPTSGEGTPDEN